MLVPEAHLGHMDQRTVRVMLSGRWNRIKDVKAVGFRHNPPHTLCLKANIQTPTCGRQDSPQSHCALFCCLSCLPVPFPNTRLAPELKRSFSQSAMFSLFGTFVWLVTQIPILTDVFPHSSGGAGAPSLA